MTSSIRLVTPAEVRQQYEGLVEGILLGVGTQESRVAILVDGAEHVVVDQQVIIAELFGGLGPVANRGGIVSDFGGRENGTNLHIVSFWSGSSSGLGS